MSNRFTLTDFVNESNKIERIPVTRPEEVVAHFNFLQAPIGVVSLEKLVDVLQPGAKLRRAYGMDVIIGNYIPPKGGIGVVNRLNTLLNHINIMTPWEAHCEYESIHPFQDGNGRSGRALWLHMMGGIDKAPLGFLHTFYYQTLGERKA